jgi:thiaminase
MIILQKLEAEVVAKDAEQQRLLSLCLEYMPQDDIYLKNMNRFQELLATKSKALDRMKKEFG